MREKSQRYVGRVDYHSEFHLAKAPQNKGSDLFNTALISLFYFLG